MTLLPKKNTTEKGQFGEKIIDAYMEELQWEIALSNQRFRGGEIDRIYLKKNIKKICICEIKTIFLQGEEQYKEIFSNYTIEKLIKKKQIINLFKFGEHWKIKNYSSFEILARFFVVFVSKTPWQPSLSPLLQENIFGKICKKTERTLILSMPLETQDWY